MRIEGFVWYRSIVDKLLWKHNVTHEEVEEIFENRPKFKFIEKGKVKKKICILLADKQMQVDIWLCYSYTNRQKKR